MNFLITGIVFCEAANSSEVYATIAGFFNTHGIQAANLQNLHETSQHRVMFDVAQIDNPNLMGELKDAIAEVYPCYCNGKPREHISIAMVTADAARIPAIMAYWMSGEVKRKPDPGLHIRHDYLRQ